MTVSRTTAFTGEVPALLIHPGHCPGERDPKEEEGRGGRSGRVPSPDHLQPRPVGAPPPLRL